MKAETKAACDKTLAPVDVEAPPPFLSVGIATKTSASLSGTSNQIFFFNYSVSLSLAVLIRRGRTSEREGKLMQHSAITSAVNGDPPRFPSAVNGDSPISSAWAIPTAVPRVMGVIVAAAGAVLAA